MDALCLFFILFVTSFICKFLRQANNYGYFLFLNYMAQITSGEILRAVRKKYF